MCPRFAYLVMICVFAGQMPVSFRLARLGEDAERHFSRIEFN
jgi:hypothetical protein